VPGNDHRLEAPDVSTEHEKQVAAEAAAELVENGMTVGLGTGSTVAYLLPALARRSLDIVCAATSPATEHAARELGLRIEDVTSIDRFDITIDGADQISPDGWLVKGAAARTTARRSSPGRRTGSSLSPTPPSRSRPCTRPFPLS
jgi:ribose 5-phosphate isomerase A